MPDRYGGRPALRTALAGKVVGLSVIPVREALKTPAGEGLVTYHPQRGYTVAEFTSESVRSVFAVRDVLEAEAERLAVVRVGADDLDVLRRACRDQETAAKKGDAVDVIAANRVFHFALFDLCGNPVLVRFVQQTRDALEPYRVLSCRRGIARRDTRRHDRIQTDHAAVIDALESGEVETALRLLAAHREDGLSAFDDYLASESVAANTV
jgi:DNA-binding GntR family transcriptional regulator